jgi:hypothetical protein
VDELVPLKVIDVTPVACTDEASRDYGTTLKSLFLVVERSDVDQPAGPSLPIRCGLLLYDEPLRKSPRPNAYLLLTGVVVVGWRAIEPR